MNTGIRSHTNGSTLLTIMILTGLMGIGLASYLTLVRYQNVSVMRSQAWNTCIPVIEAGIEEAMTHINRSGITNLATAGWELIDGFYKKTRWLDDSCYVVAISQSDPPVIISDGYVPVPLHGCGAMGFLAVATLELPNGVQYVHRRIRVTTRKDGIWALAMVAKGNIDLNGNNIASDSFDSGDPRYSTGGQYDVTKRRDKGDVATNSRILNSLNVGNANLWGRASTGPGGSVAIGPNGSVGDLNWHALGRNGIQPGWSLDDMCVSFPDVTRPYSGGFTPSSGKVGDTNVTYMLTGGNYVMTDLSLKASQILFVTAPSKLRVTGSISIAGKGEIIIGAGASLELYMEGASASIGGNGVANHTGYAANFRYFGLPAHTSLSLSGNGTFIGAIYAPNADFALNGGGSEDLDFVGASVTKTVQMNGHYKFHYDEALGRIGPARGYVVDSWNEI
jgi:hypothetical protein